MSGFINMNKPVGLTSFQVITQLRRILGIRKLGHSGVLDKPATGVLPIGVNRATKLFSYFADFRKEYLTTLLLGFATTTDDIIGEIVSTGETGGVTEKEVQLALKQFIGEISQRPPKFSTTKVDGKEFYRMALAGQEVPHKLKRVTVEDIEFVSYSDGPLAEELLESRPALSTEPAGLPPLKLLTVRIVCRGGFYVRSLARDLGELLGTQGCVFSLVREQVGPFRVEDAHTLEEMEDLAAKGQEQDAIQPMSIIAEPERTVALDAPSIAQLARGMPVVVKAHFLEGEVHKRGTRLFVTGPDGEIAAIVEVSQPIGDNLPLHPRKVLL
ncbi:tRNA pseudouridine(55) synthase TruB [bacterium]|nr:tRNA pseudouridine(55) synthase TruB [bacterium]